MKTYFVDKEGYLILRYTPEARSIEYVLSILNGKGTFSDTYFLNKTYRLTKENLVNREKDFENDDLDNDSIDFRIGSPFENGKYIDLDQAIFGISHRFLFESGINFQHSFFCKFNVSTISTLSNVAKHDIYIDLSEQDAGDSFHLSLSQFKAFIAKLATPYGIDMYKQSCAEIAASQFLDVGTSFAERFEKYTRKKYTASPYHDVQSNEYLSARIQELEQQRDLLKAALHCQDEPEEFWQQAIAGLLPLLYPKYLYIFEKFEFESLEETKIPDFIAIDNDGNVDVIEIKKANIGNVLRKYRNNYVPTSEISCACAQIEHYIFRMMSNKRNVETKIEEQYRSKIGSLKINVINPQGILIAGVSDELPDTAKRDFEVAKRMHKHIYDIVTYDMLLERLQNTINAYKNKISLESKAGG